MNIREIDKKDLGSLIKLYQEFWGDKSNLENMQNLYDELIKNPDYIILCAEIEQKVVGTLMGIVCYELYGECKPFIVMENLVIDSNYRKKGIAKSLLTELEKIAKSKKCSQIQFITEKNRNDAISFYTAMGFNPSSHIGFKKVLKYQCD